VRGRTLPRTVLEAEPPSIGPVATTLIELNPHQGGVCSSRLLSAPHVPTDIAGVIAGDQANEPGICPRWRLGLNCLRSRKSPLDPSTFDFTL
jgi:hypothetical protein